MIIKLLEVDAKFIKPILDIACTFPKEKIADEYTSYAVIDDNAYMRIEKMQPKGMSVISLESIIEIIEAYNINFVEISSAYYSSLFEFE